MFSFLQSTFKGELNHDEQSRWRKFCYFRSDFHAIVTPEDFTEEHRMIAETTRDFVNGEVMPNDEHLEKLDYDLTVKLMRSAGDLGLLGADVPEIYGGLGLDKVSSTDY